MKKKVISLALGATLAVGGAFTVTACGGAPSDTVSLTLWGAANQQAMLNEMVEVFKQANPQTNYQITLAVVGESDAYTQLKTDVSAGADVFAFAHDQLINLNRLGALAQLGGVNLNTVKNDNSAEAVQAATIGSGVYAYPYSADNGYFLYYNKSVVSEEQAQTLDGILSACQAKGKKFVYDVDNSWYLGGMFFGTGCDYSVTYNEDGSALTEVTCNFNDPVKGVAAGKAILSLNAHSAFLNGDDTVLNAGFADGTVAAAVSGTWNATAIEEALGENYAACKLPTFTVDGQTYQMGSFSGYKMYGVNATSNNLAEAHRLAAFLSGEAMQQKRYEDIGTGPSNKTVADSEAVKADVALSALLSQNAHAKLQLSVPANYWTAVEAFGKDVVAGTVNSTNLKSKLDAMVASILVSENT